MREIIYCSLSLSLPRSLSAFVNTELGLLENCLTFQQCKVKTLATCVSPKYRMVYEYLWRTAGEVKAEE